MSPLTTKIIAAVGSIGLCLAIRIYYARNYKHGADVRVRRNPGREKALLMCASIGGYAVPLLYVFTPLFNFADYAIPFGVSIAGIVLLIPANWLFYRSHKDLGKNWSPILEIRHDHRFVTSGVFRRIRHPMYTSLWLYMIAQAMLFQNLVAGFAGLLGFGLTYFLRVGGEETLMLEEFGDEYRDYMKRSGRLLPRF